MNPPNQNLQPGATGPAVKQLQDWLVANGYMTQSQENTGPGTYGPQTTAAVKAVQQKLGVDNSSGPGYWGPKTMAAVTQTPKQTGPVPVTNGGSTIPFSTKDQNGNVNFDTGNPALDTALGSLYSFAKNTLAQGNVVNPALQITPDLAKQFLAEAHSQIDPEGQQHLTNAISDINASLTNLQKTYDNATAEQQSQFEQSLGAERNSAGANGIAFSGTRGLTENYMQGSQNRNLANLANNASYAIGKTLRAGGEEIGNNPFGLTGSTADFNVPTLMGKTSTLEGPRGGVGADTGPLSYNYDPNAYKIGSVPQTYATNLLGSANNFLSSYQQSAANNSRTFQNINGVPTLT